MTRKKFHTGKDEVYGVVGLDYFGFVFNILEAAKIHMTLGL